MMVFKVGVAGTHSTGKTTFLDKLEAKTRSLGLRVNRVSDIGSKASSAGFPILRNHTFESTLWIMSQSTADELRAALTCDVLLVDRPVIDALGYLNAALRYRAETLPDWQSDLLAQYAWGYARSYDVLLKTTLDPAIPLGIGKERDRDEAFRIMVAQEMDIAFSRTTIKFRALDAHSREEHLDGVTREIILQHVPAGVLAD